MVPEISKKFVFGLRGSRCMKNSFFLAFVMDPATLKIRATRDFETSGLPAIHQLFPGDRSSRLQCYGYLRTRKIICSPLPFPKEIIKVMMWPCCMVSVLIFEPADRFPRNTVWTSYYWRQSQSIFLIPYLTNKHEERRNLRSSSDCAIILFYWSYMRS